METLWGLWRTLSNYIPKKDQEQAIEEFLQYLYEEVDDCNFFELRDTAEYEEETLFLKIIKRFIKENEIDQEDY